MDTVDRDLVTEALQMLGINGWETKSVILTPFHVVVVYADGRDKVLEVR